MVATQRRIVRGVFNLEPYEINYSLPAWQVYENLPEKFPAEIIDNKLYVSPFPTFYHADVNQRIYDELSVHVRAQKLGEIWCVPLGVFPEDPNRTVVGPDIVFVSRHNPATKELRGIFGIPDLLIEVLSSNRKYDLTTKKSLYERTGVKEVWYVDPVSKNTTGYFLENAKYGEPLLMNSEIHVRTFNKTFKF